jgi:hypothetical protein
LVAWTEQSTIAMCTHYRHSRTSSAGSPALECEDVLRCVSRGTTAPDVGRAFADADVSAALAEKKVLFGSDPRPVDGQVFQIKRGDSVIEVGGDCSGAPACKTTPQGVRTLVELLRGLDTQELALAVCAGTFP